MQFGLLNTILSIVDDDCMSSPLCPSETYIINICTSHKKNVFFPSILPGEKMIIFSGLRRVAKFFWQIIIFRESILGHQGAISDFI